MELHICWQSQQLRQRKDGLGEGDLTSIHFGGRRRREVGEREASREGGKLRRKEGGKLRRMGGWRERLIQLSRKETAGY